MKPCGSEEWGQLLASWQDETERFRLSTGKKSEHRSVALKWWSTTAKVLSNLQARILNEEPLDPSPNDVLKVLAGMSEYLAAGIVPGPVNAVRGRGKPPIGPTEARDISWASAYMRLCADGAIPDPAYVSTVCHHFDVARQTAQKWKLRTIVSAVAVHMSDPRLIEVGM